MFAGNSAADSIGRLSEHSQCCLNKVLGYMPRPELPRWAEQHPSASLIPEGFSFSIHIAPASPTRLYQESFVSIKDTQPEEKLGLRRRAEAVSKEASKDRRARLAAEVGHAGYQLHLNAKREDLVGCETWMVVRRLRRVNRPIVPRDVTLICCQANGLPVEVSQSA